MIEKMYLERCNGGCGCCGNGYNALMSINDDTDILKAKASVEKALNNLGY
jgi:hypothetical protein